MCESNGSFQNIGGVFPDEKNQKAALVHSQMHMHTSLRSENETTGTTLREALL